MAVGTSLTISAFGQRYKEWSAGVCPMQASIPEFPSETMAVTESRFQKLEQRVSEIGERIAKLETGCPSPSPHGGTLAAWFPIGAPVVALIAVIVTLGIHLDNKIGAVNSSIGTIEGRLGKVESAVKVLGDNQGKQNQQIIHDLLSAATSADVRVAPKILNTAESLVTALKNEKRPASPEFFQSEIDFLNNPKIAKSGPIADDFQRVRIVLAEYRSSLQTKPEFPKEFQNIPTGSPALPNISGRAMYLVSRGLPLPTGINLVSDGAVLNGGGIPAGNNLLNVVANPMNPKTSSVTGLILIAPQQILDRIEWNNVTFVNTHIVYAGGPLKLKNVHFVNCTFETPSTDRGIMLLNYATLGKDTLSLG